MEINRILCPIDFSSTSDFALGFASRLARANKGKLFILHVDDNPTPYGPGLYGSLPSPIESDYERLWKTTPIHHVEFEQFLEFGSPAKTICSFAVDNNIDLIVMGSHGRTGARRLLLGTVAENVIRQSRVPVITIKHPEKVNDVVALANEGESK